MDRCKYNKFVGCNIKECDTCEVYKVYQQGKKDEHGYPCIQDIKEILDDVEFEVKANNENKS